MSVKYKLIVFQTIHQILRLDKSFVDFPGRVTFWNGVIIFKLKPDFNDVQGAL